MGIKNAAPNRTHHMNIFQKHYFLEEETPFSAYYIKHLSDVPDDAKSGSSFACDKFNMEYNVDHWRKTRTFIKASNLVRELFKQGFFKPITFGEYHILNTVFYNEVDADIKNINLEYDKDNDVFRKSDDEQLLANNSKIFLQKMCAHITIAQEHTVKEGLQKRFSNYSQVTALDIVIVHIDRYEVIPNEMKQYNQKNVKINTNIKINEIRYKLKAISYHNSVSSLGHLLSIVFKNGMAYFINDLIVSFNSCLLYYENENANDDGDDNRNSDELSDSFF